MFCVSALTRLVTSCLGRSFSWQEDFSDAALGQAPQKLPLVERELSEGNLLLPPSSAAGNQASPHNVMYGRTETKEANGTNSFPSGPLRNYFLREVWKIIVQFLNIKDIKSLRRVSREMNVIASPHIRVIEIVNAKELLGALNFLMQAGSHTTTLRLANTGWARSVSLFDSYPSFSDKNLKIELDKSQHEKAISRVQQASCSTQDSILPVKNLQFYRIDLTQVEFILDNETHPSFSKWKKVESLDIKECQLSIKSFTKILQAMPNLKNLGLYQCTGLSDLDLAMLGFSSFKMAALTINQAGLDALALKNFSLLEKLESLCLVACDMSNIFLQVILKNKPKLKKLEINSCVGLTYSAFSALKELNLESLKLIRCQISDEVFQDVLEGQDDLKILEVNSCPRLTQAAFNVLEKLKLYYLRIVKCSLSDDVLQAILIKQSDLKRLELDLKTGLTQEVIFFLEKFKLQSLRLNHGDFSESMIQNVVKVIKNLEVLYLNECYGVDTKLFTGAVLLESLKDFGLEGYRLPDIAFEVMIKTMPNVEVLRLNNIKFLSVTGFLDLAVLKKVESLTLEKSEFSNDFFPAITVALPNLKNLHLRKCFGFTDVGLLNLVQLKKLEFLDIRDCQFSKRTLNAIKKHVRNVIS